MDMKNILSIIDGKVGPQTSTSGKEDMKHFMSIVSDIPTITKTTNNDAAEKFLKESIGESAYEHPAGKELSRIGRILMDKAATTKDEKLSTVFGRVGDELTRFGVPGGVDSTEALVKKTGVSFEAILKMMDWASKQKDATLDVIDEPEELEVNNDDDFGDDEDKIIDVGDAEEEDEKIGEMSFTDYLNLAEAASRLNK